MVKKLVVGIVAGAAVGAAVSLLSRDTREKTAQKVTNLKTDAQYYYHSRHDVKEVVPEVEVESSGSKIKALFENIMENKEFYLEKIEILKETTPKILAQLQATKEAFIKPEELITNDVKSKEKQEEPKKPEDVIHL